MLVRRPPLLLSLSQAFRPWRDKYGTRNLPSFLLAIPTVAVMCVDAQLLSGLCYDAVLWGRFWPAAAAAAAAATAAGFKQWGQFWRQRCCGSYGEDAQGQLAICSCRTLVNVLGLV